VQEAVGRGDHGGHHQDQQDDRDGARSVTHAGTYASPAETEVSEGGARSPGDQDQHRGEEADSYRFPAQEAEPTRDGEQDQHGHRLREAATGVHS
jgi:hypothetical protein